jgi:hypothetical protein
MDQVVILAEIGRYWMHVFLVRVPAVEMITCVLLQGPLRTLCLAHSCAAMVMVVVVFEGVKSLG